MFLGFSVVYGLRVNLSVAMVAMVNNSDARPAENRSAACPLPATPTGDNSSTPAGGLPDLVRPGFKIQELYLSRTHTGCAVKLKSGGAQRNVQQSKYIYI